MTSRWRPGWNSCCCCNSKQILLIAEQRGQRGYYHCPKILAIYQNYNFQAMKVAIERGDLQTVKAMIDAGGNLDSIDVNEETGSQHSILIYAISMNQFAIAKLLVEKGARVDTVFLNYDKENKCIYEISAAATARMLYEVTLDNNLGQVLHSIEEALKKCQGREPRCVAPHSLPPDIPKQVIIDAIEEGDLFSVKLLINHGMDVNAILQDEVGNQVSILIAAIAQWHIRIATFLIDRGAKVGTIFQNFNEENHKVFEVSALSIACVRHRQSPKSGMKEVVDSIESSLRQQGKNDTPEVVTSTNVPNEAKQHSKITAWLHKPVPTITVDTSSDIEDIDSNGEPVINGNAKKYSADDAGDDDRNNTPVERVDGNHNNIKTNGTSAQTNNNKQCTSGRTTTNTRTSDSSVTDPKMCVIL